MAFTDEELKELELPRKIADEWQLIMNELWKHSQINYYAKAEENEIVIGDYRIGVYFYNKSWLEFKMEKGNKTFLMVRFDNNIPTIIKCMDAILGSGLKKIVKS